VFGQGSIDHYARYAENYGRGLEGQRARETGARGTYDESEANEPMDGGAVSGLRRVAFRLGQPLIYQAVEKQCQNAFYQESKKL
jgi:hypothetical protein